MAVHDTRRKKAMANELSIEQKRAIAMASARMRMQQSAASAEKPSESSASQIASDIAWPTAGAVIGGTFGGPFGAVLGAGAGTTAQKFLEGASAGEAVQEGLQSSAFEGAFGLAGAGLKAVAKSPAGKAVREATSTATDAVGSYISDVAAKVAPSGVLMPKGAPARNLAGSDSLLAKVDDVLATAFGTGDEARRAQLSQEFTNRIETLVSRFDSNASIGDQVQNISRELSALSAQGAELAREKAIAEATKKGVKVNIKPLKDEVAKRIKQLKDGGIKEVPEDLALVQRQLNGVADTLSPQAAQELRRIFGELSDRSPEFGRYLTSSKQAASGVAIKGNVTIDDLIMRSDKAFGDELASLQRISRRDLNVYIPVAESLARKSPEAAADLLSTFKGKPRVVKSLIRSVKNNPNFGPQAVERIQQKQLANLLADSKGAIAAGPLRESVNQATGKQIFQGSETLSGKKLLANLDALEGADEIIGVEQAKSLRLMGEALARIQKAPAVSGIVSVRSLQIGSLVGLVFGITSEDGASNVNMAQATGLILGPAALSRMLRSPNVQKSFIRGISTPTKAKGSQIIRRAAAQALREAYDSGEVEGVEINGQAYPINSSEAQQVLQQKFGLPIKPPEVPFRRE